MSYQQQALAGATGVELIVALYDGLMRFLYRAMQCVEENDVHGRRVAVKKALDILMYLQARLRPDVGGTVAASLGDFYSTMFTLTLEASHLESREQFQEVISFVRNVREAWVVVARDPEAGRVLPRELRTREEKFLPSAEVHAAAAGETGRLRSSGLEQLQRWFGLCRFQRKAWGSSPFDSAQGQNDNSYFIFTNSKLKLLRPALLLNAASRRGWCSSHCVR